MRMNRSGIDINPEILGGTPVFPGTRVPVKILFDYLEGEETLDEFLESYPTVSKEQALQVLHLAGEFLSSVKNLSPHENTP